MTRFLWFLFPVVALPSLVILLTLIIMWSLYLDFNFWYHYKEWLPLARVSHTGLLLLTLWVGIVAGCEIANVGGGDD